jgi:hypothetical protein
MVERMPGNERGELEKVTERNKLRERERKPE